MSRYEFILGPDGRVTNSPLQIECAIEDLAEIFSGQLESKQAVILQNIIALFKMLTCVPDPGLNKQGWASFIAAFRETEDWLDIEDSTVEITQEAYTRLNEILAVDRKAEPDLNS